MVKKSTFCKLLYHKKCKQRGVGGENKTNFVNIVCERPLVLWMNITVKYFSTDQWKLQIFRSPLSLTFKFLSVFQQLFCYISNSPVKKWWHILCKMIGKFCESAKIEFFAKISKSVHKLHNNSFWQDFIQLFQNFQNESLKLLLELVCCKKQLQIVPDQLLVCGIGDLGSL